MGTTRGLKNSAAVLRFFIYDAGGGGNCARLAHLKGTAKVGRGDSKEKDWLKVRRERRRGGQTKKDWGGGGACLQLRTVGKGDHERRSQARSREGGSQETSVGR